jgi:hypothetical protein
LQVTLPPEVHILTIEPISQDKTGLTVLFRIEHIYDQNEHSKFSKSVTIEIDVNIHQTIDLSLIDIFCIIETIQ